MHILVGVMALSWFKIKIRVKLTISFLIVALWRDYRRHRYHQFSECTQKRQVLYENATVPVRIWQDAESYQENRGASQLSSLGH